MERIYFSRNNYNLLYNIIGEKLYKKHGYDIGNDSRFEKEVVNILKSVYQQKETYNIDSTKLNEQDYSNELSKNVLNICLQYFSSYIEKNNLNKGENIKETYKNNNQGHKKLQINSINREIETTNFDNENRVDSRPIPSVIHETNDVNKMYENLQNERTSMLNSGPPKNVDFSDKQPTNIEKFNVTSRFDEMTKKRGQEFLDNPHNDNNNNRWNSDKTIEKNTNRNIELKVDSKNDSIIANSQENFENSSNNVLPGFGESDSGGIDAQFGTLTNDSTSLEDLKKKFEATSVEDRLKAFQQERSNDINLQEKDKKVEINDISQNNIEPSVSNNFTKENTVLNNSKLPSISEHPKEIHSTNSVFEINKQVSTRLNDFYNVENMEVVKPKDYSTKIYSLIINSIDRQWYGLTKTDGSITYESPFIDRYNYTVNFAPQSTNTIKIPIYENNEHKALNINDSDDKIKILKGLRDKNNDASGFDYNGRNYAKYNPSKPKGNIIDYEYGIVKSGDDNISIDRTFKNIVSVKLKRLILPCFDENCSVPIDDDCIKHFDVPNGCKTEPYLLVHIDELDSNIVSTNNSFNKSLFCKAHFDKEFRYNDISTINNESTNTRGWTYFKNDDGDIAKFKTPLAELNKLSISILRPDGSIYSDIKDDLQICKIEPGVSCGILKLTLNNPVNHQYFKNGDKIIVKSLFGIGKTIPAWLVRYLEQGVQVIKSTEISNDGDEYTNILTVKNKISSQPTDNVNNYEDISGIGTACAGFIINTNLQHSLILEVTVKETDLHAVSTSELV